MVKPRNRQAMSLGRTKVDEEKRKSDEENSISGCRHILNSGSRCGEPTPPRSAYCPAHGDIPLVPSGIMAESATS
jgi:hypothetical protein